MSELRSERESLLGTFERRQGAGKLRVSDESRDGQIILEGYAATYDPYDCHGGPQGGGWVEQLAQTAFDETLAAKPDVQLLINHTGTPLARTTSGTLKLTRDSHGLRVWASLDESDPDVQALVPKMRRGDMDEMSFAFRVNDQSWNTSYSHRTINSLSLEKGDVSVVNYGMNPATKAVIADAVGMLAQLSNKELVELRSVVDVAKVRRAQAVLAQVANPGRAGSRPAQRADGDKSKEPYGDVPYADPGYQKDGKKRYPIDSKEKAKAAWSYINMAKNQKGYSPAQVKSIKGRIEGALKKFGVTVSEEKSAADVGIEQIQRADGGTSLVAVMPDGTKVLLPSSNDQRVMAPQDRPAPKRFPDDKGTFDGNAVEDWEPNASPDDAHDDPYEVGTVGVPGTGPVPDNIMGGNFTGQKPTFKTPATATDPHDVSIDQEMLAMDAMDPHDGPYDFGAYPGGNKVTPQAGVATDGGDPHNTPYNVGAQVGGVPGDRPNYGDFPQGPVAPNIGTTGAPLGGKMLPAISAPAGVGTEPVGGDAKYDWTAGDIGEPWDPEEDLNAPAMRPGIGTRGMSMDDPHNQPAGSSGAFHGASGSWDAYDPETGMSSTVKPKSGGAGAECCSDDEMASRNDDGDEEMDCMDEVKLDMGLVEALDRTIVHTYKLAGDNQEVRRGLAIARKQLKALAGVKTTGETEISKRLSELRSVVGAPDTGTVSAGLAYLRSEGTAPVGYRGLLDHDPGVHLETPAERLAKEALAKDRRARDAAAEADVASQRVKAAQREAELNAVIRRHRKGL